LKMHILSHFSIVLIAVVWVSSQLSSCYHYRAQQTFFKISLHKGLKFHSLNFHNASRCGSHTGWVSLIPLNHQQQLYHCLQILALILGPLHHRLHHLV
jgi:hypothetical protein